jgi:hypothetical protein
MTLVKTSLMNSHPLISSPILFLTVPLKQNATFTLPDENLSPYPCLCPLFFYWPTILASWVTPSLISSWALGLCWVNQDRSTLGKFRVSSVHMNWVCTRITLLDLMQFPELLLSYVFFLGWGASTSLLPLLLVSTALLSPFSLIWKLLLGLEM